MTDTRPHRKLVVWKKSIELVVLICRVSGTYPKSEQFGLTSQMRRAAVSVPSNLAEGAARKGKEGIQTVPKHRSRLHKRAGHSDGSITSLGLHNRRGLRNPHPEIDRNLQKLYGLAKTLE